MMNIWNASYLPMVKWSLSHERNLSSSTVLDIGVGNGQSTFYLQSCLPKADVIGIDISETAINQSKTRYPTIHFYTMDVKKTIFEEKQFELICAFQTHFHWSTLEESFIELHRILADDGRLVLSSEKTKINYFLPHLKSSEQFQQFLSTVNLTIVTINENAQWISYHIKKL